MTALTYTASGVNRRDADQFIDTIAHLAQSTLNRKVKAGIGGYASLFELNPNTWLAASTDGVGTKLKLAFELDQHETVGIDLVAMSVNDLLCVGAQPLFFLDYFATGKLDRKTAPKVLKGIVEGCRQAGCALVGGETAEMPDFYSPGEYDLAGFAVGTVARKSVLPKKIIKPGDTLIGIASSGCHSNGFSLLRRLLREEGKSAKTRSRMRQLLTPTRIYSRALLPLIESGILKGAAHITGSGFLNVPRISEAVNYEIHLPPQKERPDIFKWIRSKNISFEEEAQTFNLGVGMVLAVSPQHASKALRMIKKAGEQAWEVGQTIPQGKEKKSEVFLYEGEHSTRLS